MKIVKERKMTDLTAAFLAANEMPKFADNAEFAAFLQEMMDAHHDFSFDWDDGAGEDWAVISDTKHMICMIHRVIKLAFVFRKYNHKVSDVLDGFHIVSIDDWGKETWSIDLKVLRANVPDVLWHTPEEAIDPNRFSLLEMFFATV